MFFNNEFALTGLEPILTNDGEIELNGLTFETLPEELQDIFKNAHLQVYSFDDATEEDIVEIMSRLNNGKPLSAIDNTRIKAKDLAGIKRLGQHKLFTEYMSGVALDSHMNEEVVVKTYITINDEKSSLDNKDVRPVYESLEITADVESKLLAVFDMMYATIQYMFEKGKDNANYKKAAKKILKKTHLISVMTLVNMAVESGKACDELGEMLVQMFEEGNPTTNEEYNLACKDGSNHANNVQIRRTALVNDYNFYFQGEEHDAE